MPGPRFRKLIGLAGLLAIGWVLPGCALVDMFDPTDPVTPARTYGRRAPLTPGSVTSRRQLVTPGQAVGSAQMDDVYGPLSKPQVAKTSPPGKPRSSAAGSAATSPDIAVAKATPTTPAGNASNSTDFSKPDSDVSQTTPVVPGTSIHPPIASSQKPQGQKPIEVEPEVVPEVEPTPAKPTAPVAVTSADAAGGLPAFVSHPDQRTLIVPAKPDTTVVRTPVTGTSAPRSVTPASKPTAVASAKPMVAEEPAATSQLTPEQQKLRRRINDLNERIKAGLDVDERDDRGRTLLQQAAIAGELEVMEVLLAAGANIRAQDRQGWSALHWSASSGHPEACEMLIASGSAVDPRGYLDDTPLQWASAFDRRDVVELLIARGADVNAADKRGKTALFAAVENDARATAIVLLAHGADLKLRDESGLTALHQSILQCRKALVELDAAPAAGDATPAVGNEPAEREQARKQIVARCRDLAKVLLEKGADVNAASPRGITPLHLAAWDDMQPVTAVLLSFGADPGAKDARDRTPVDYARTRKQSGAVTVLAETR